MSNITIYYLEMNSPEAFLGSKDNLSLNVVESEIKQFKINRFLYQLVGEQWQWLDKNKWTDKQWKDYAEDMNLRTWIAYHRGTIAGYFELKTNDDHSVEIAYFGLAPQFIGKGFGGYLLSQAIINAWEIPNTSRVKVNTCTLDHPNALKNYQARGMQIYKTEVID